MAEEHPQQAWFQEPDFSEKFAKAAIERWDDHQARLESSRRSRRMQRSWLMYYSRSEDGSCDETEINTAGNRDEVLLLNPARYRRLIQDHLNLVMQTPPDYQPEARNTDPESQAQCALTLGILDDYKRRCHLEDLRAERAEVADVLSESFLHIRWDADKGEMSVPAGDAGGKPVYEGDFVFSVRTPYEHASDPTSPDRRKPRWQIVQEPVSKWDLLKNAGAEPGPEGDKIRERIVKAPKWSAFTKRWKFEKDEYQHDDTISVYYVYVEKCPALPDGRRALLLDGETVLEDGPLDEDRAGVFRLATSDVIFKAEGHTNNFDGMPLAKAYGAQFSTILSNHATYALARLLAARAAGVKTNQLDAGLGVVYFDHFDQKTGVAVPEPHLMDNGSTPAELFTFADMIGRELDTIMGGSPVTRGDPNATKGDSGSKAAMLFAAAQNVSSGAIRAILRSDEEIATWMIASLRRHATVERITSIAGRKNTYTAKRWKGEDLKAISRVNVRHADPARDTFAGRVTVAELRLQAKTPQDRADIDSLITTGRLEPALEDDEGVRILIERENEALGDPKADMPVVTKTEQHLAHIAKHAIARDSNPEYRADQEISGRFDDHIAGHLQALTPGMPGFAGYEILMATNQQPFPEVSGEPDAVRTGGRKGAQQPQQGKPGGNGGGNGGAPERPSKKPGGAAGEGQPARMPQQPVNPATGERVNLPVPGAPAVGGVT